MTLFRASVSALALATLAQAAAAQGVPTGGGSGGGGSGGGSGTVTSVTTTCPTSSNSPTGGVVAIIGGTPTTTQTGSSYTIQSTDCGSDISFTYSGTASIVVPAAGTVGTNFVVILSAASGTTLSVSSLGGNFLNNGTTSLTVSPGQAASLVSNGMNWVVNVSASGGSSLTLAGSSGAIQTNNGSGSLSSIAPGSGVATSLAGNTNSNGGLATQNGAISAGDCLIENSGVADAGVGCGNWPTPVGNGSIGTSSELFYPLWPGAPVVTANALTANQEQCAPFFLVVAQHWDEIVFDVATVGSTSVEVALYMDAVDATTHRHQPQAVDGGGTYFSSAITDTSTGVLTWPLGTAGTGISMAAGLHWICINTADVTLPKFYAVSSVTTAITTGLVGSFMAANATSNLMTGMLRYNSTFNTWATLTGVTMTEIAGSAEIPAFAARVASVP